MTRLAAICASFALTACNPGAYGEAPAKTCAESGVRCELADGPLGVCVQAECAEGAPSPCFTCMPQH